MKYIKTYENFKAQSNVKLNNIDGTLINTDDIITCIKNNGVIYATIIKDLPNNDPDKAITPVSVDDDGLVTIEYDGSEYEIKLDNIEKVEF
jgi:hypothetical protein